MTGILGVRLFLKRRRNGICGRACGRVAFPKDWDGWTRPFELAFDRFLILPLATVLEYRKQ